VNEPGLGAAAVVLGHGGVRNLALVRFERTMSDMTNKKLPPKVRRNALQVLSRARLAGITEKFKLSVKDRRAAASHVTAIIQARSLDFGDVLQLFQRDELKAICTALALDPAGREKETIVQRILAAGDATGRTT